MRVKEGWRYKVGDGGMVLRCANPVLCGTLFRRKLYIGKNLDRKVRTINYRQRGKIFCANRSARFLAREKRDQKSPTATDSAA